MTVSTATLSNYRQAPRKVRLIADLVRGLSAEHALAIGVLGDAAEEVDLELLEIEQRDEVVDGGSHANAP